MVIGVRLLRFPLANQQDMQINCQPRWQPAARQLGTGGLVTPVMRKPRFPVCSCGCSGTVEQTGLLARDQRSPEASRPRDQQSREASRPRYQRSREASQPGSAEPRGFRTPGSAEPRGLPASYQRS
ncbi:hypothetical protein MDA_GLEAN10010544 [Myotis davidii]|uniref:Uncharacterized protein n=1 Tax=Myotis davidii TaxID=225400 RepID=L5M2T5_MYODS|nr:hypothetical protein MDA_GLEAN10010544 [Myotis davidii]